MLIEGDDNHNRLQGGEDYDEIFGYGGDDTLIGAGGDDNLHGGAGSDLLIGGAGSEYIWDDEGSNTFLGGGGDDALIGGYEFDSLVGGAGDDQLYDYGSSVARGGGGADSIAVGLESTAYGGAGDDVLGVNGHGAVLRGGSGSDSLAAIYSSRVTMKAGSGDDQVRFDGSDANQGPPDRWLDGGAGVDDLLLVLDGNVRDLDVRTMLSSEVRVAELNLTMKGFEGGLIRNDIGLQNTGILVRTGDLDFDVFTGIYADTILAGSADSWFMGGEGDDLIRAGGGADTLDGGGGDDVLNGTGGNDTVFIRAGETQVDLRTEARQFTGMGFDRFISIENLTGGTGRDRFVGNGKANLLNDGEGYGTSEAADTLIGGGGDDTLAAAAGTASDHLKGGTGADVFAFFAYYFGEVGAADRITDFEVSDTLDLSGIDADVATFGEDDDFVIVSHFTGAAGEAVLTYRAARDLTVLRLDTDGDSEANLVIRLNGEHSDIEHLVL